MLRNFLGAIRFRECTLMIGFPLMGLAAAQPNPHFFLSFRFLGFIIGTFLLSGSVYAFNSWGGLIHDRLNQRHSSHPLMTGKITPTHVLLLSLLLFVLSLAVYFPVSPVLTLLAIPLKVNWMLYSKPRRPWKGLPLAGTMLHLAGGTLQALLGQVVWGGSVPHGLPWSIFFAFLFTAGHFFHEVLDHEADKEAGLRTNAIVFGPRAGQVMSAATFAIAGLYLVALTCSGTASVAQAVPFLAAGAVQAVLLLRIGVEAHGEALFRYQARYRALYAAAGLAMAVMPLFRD